MTIGQRIKKARKEQGYTLDELARACNTIRQTIYKYENGVITNIPSDKIEAIASFLGVSESWLMGWSDSPTTAPETVGELSPEEQQLILRYRELSNSEKDMICRSMGVARQHDMSRRISPQKRMVLKLKRGR